jgi:hypothetical protein
MKGLTFTVRQLHRYGAWYVRANMESAIPRAYVTDDFGNLVKVAHCGINHYARQEH